MSSAPSPVPHPTIAANVLPSMIAAARDSTRGVVDRFRSLPITRSAVPFGQAAATAGMPAWLRVISDWNPVSALAAASCQLFGNPGAARYARPA